MFLTCLGLLGFQQTRIPPHTEQARITAHPSGIHKHPKLLYIFDSDLLWYTKINPTQHKRFKIP